MKRTCKRVLALLLVALILCGNGSIPTEVSQVHASQEIENKELTSEKMTDSTSQQDTKEKETKDSEEESNEEDSQETSTEEENQEEEQEEDSREEEASTEESDSQTTEQAEKEEVAANLPEEKYLPGDVEIETDEVELYSTLGPHDVDMPDVTSHYFTLQKNSKKVSAASGSNLKVVADVNAAARYIFKEMPNGNLYSFTPRVTSSSKVSVGGGNNGGVAFSTVKGSNYKQFGNLFAEVNNGHIQTQVFDLAKCTTNPYAIYTNVGTWYDSSTRKTYSVDVKLTVTGYLFPSQKIRKQLNNPYKAPYVGFNNGVIGVTVMGTDYVQTAMTFYYHNTSKEISNLRGVMQFCDIDAQQGVDFGSGFQKVIMFNTSGSHLQYNSSGLISGSRGYVSSRSVTNLNASDTRTTVLGVFAGATVNCRWTVAKCDQKDTGGNAAYAAKGGYKIPADDSQKDAISYYYSNSTGFLGIYADIGLIPVPSQVEKAEYAGKIDPSQSTTQTRELTLPDRSGLTTFVIRAAAASSSNLTKAKYNAFRLEDHLAAAFAVRKEDIHIYSEQSVESSNNTYMDVTNWFQISLSEENDHKTYVKAEATASVLTKAGFYGRTFYLHIPARIRSEEELKEWNMSLTQWYQKDNKLGEELSSSNSYQGVVAIENRAGLYAINNLGNTASLTTQKTAVKIGMRAIVRKFGDDKDTPVKGVTFGLFGGKPELDKTEAKPILTAVTDEKGYAIFEKDTFFSAEYGDGPYHIREISVPEEYKNVWTSKQQQAWTYIIENLDDLRLYEGNKEILMEALDGKDSQHKQEILWNEPYENPANKVIVYKESKETKELLKDALFSLYEWSEIKKDYVKVMDLKEGTDQEDKVCYKNDIPFANTMDNLGRYKVLEEKAPKGCYNSHEEWFFESNEEINECKKTFVNELQKVRLTILKSGEDEKPLKDVRFRVKAAEDIYAPWVEEEKDRSDQNLLVARGTIVDTLTTDENGKAQTSKGQEMFVGTYEVEEVDGAVGYICETISHTVTLKYGEEGKDKILEYSIPISNEKMQPAMAVAKLADRTTNAQGQAVSFQTVNGRYVEEKKSGTYQAEEKVDYTITVTNTGNVTLYDLELKDTMDHIIENQGYTLKDFTQEGSAHFLLPKEGYYLSKDGKKVMVDQEENDFCNLHLDELSVKDSVAVHFEVTLKEGASNAFALRNEVVLNAKYKDRQGENVEGELQEVPTENLLDEDGNSLVKDWDEINIPGTAIPKVAKLADKTSGVTIKDGRYEGKKMEGLYEYGEPVDFTITVSNCGTADLYQILVEDVIDEKLLQALKEDSISFADGTYITSLGEEIHAVNKEEKEKGKHTLLLDYLLAGDSVDLHLQAIVKTGIPAMQTLKNDVVISAEYQTGIDTFESVPRTPEMEDSDTIGIAVPDLAIAKMADKTTGIHLKDGRYVGKRKTATYQAGDKVLFTITITNCGTGKAKNVIITENPSGTMKKYLTMKGFQNHKDEILTTAQDKQVIILQADMNQLTLDQLLPGDSVEIIYEAKVNEKIVTVKNLENEAKVSGENGDGSKMKETERMKDSDQLHLKVKKSSYKDKGDFAGKVSGSNPKTGDDFQTMSYVILGSLALAGTAFLLYRRKRQS